MKRDYSFFQESCGSATVMFVILMFAFVGLLAFVIDLAHVKTVKTEIQNAGDASALRGARAFLPDNIPTTGPYQVDPDADNAKLQAQNAISDNKSDNTAFQVGDLPIADIQVGIWDFINKNLMAWQWPPDNSLWGQYIGPAISLPTKRTDSTSLGPVSMTLARIFGIEQVFLNARATAALSGVGGFRENGGKPDVPVCINVSEVLEHEGDIVFNPDHDDSGGWTNLRPISENDHTDANDIKRFFRGERGPGELAPGNNEVSLNNGVMCSATHTFIDEGANNLEPPLILKLKEGTKNTWIPDPDIYSEAEGNPIPSYTFPVCEKDKFNQWHTVGAVTAQILQVSSAPDACSFNIKITGDVTTLPGTYGGGRWYGVLSTEPKLVE
jgi:hypothetical protein